MVEECFSFLARFSALENKKTGPSRFRPFSEAEGKGIALGLWLTKSYRRSFLGLAVPAAGAWFRDDRAETAGAVATQPGQHQGAIPQRTKSIRAGDRDRFWC